MEAAIRHVEDGLSGVRGITLTARAKEEAQFGAGLVGPLVVPLNVTVAEGQARDLVARLRSRLAVGTQNQEHVEIHLLGESALAAAVADASKQELKAAERIGFPVLLLVLIAIFGSLTAAMLPIAFAAVVIVVSGALIYDLSLITELSTFTVNTSSMFGIGVAVDYCLIILSRVRQELRAGHDLPVAWEIASRTAGRAVVFSGVTVVLSLAAVWVVPIATLRSMAVGAMIAVSVAVLASTTLLPALIMALGARRLSQSWRGTAANGRLAGLRWSRWARVVMARPIYSIAGACVILLPLCIPVTSMKTSTGALQQLRSSNETRVGFEKAARLQGPGALAPIFVVLERRGGVSALALHGAAVRSRHLAGGLSSAREVGQIRISKDGLRAVFSVLPRVDPESKPAERMVANIRSALNQTLARTGIKALVGGGTASQLDEEQSIAGSIWRLVLAVLLASFCILAVLLRSLVLPVKAIVMNLISVGVAYGVLVIVFQWGWLDHLLHYAAPGHIYTLVPPLLLAVVFGLSMDYEVFLLARIREQWELTGDQRQAVSRGLEASAGTITSAALILVCVFAIFIGTGNPTIKELGVGAAVAIGVDATLIRLVLVPATMAVLGRWNWWLPTVIDNAMPRFMARPADAVSAT
jgi:RND superfamily putative drug exporter